MKIFICMLFLFFGEIEHNLSPTSVNWKSGMFSGTIKMIKGTLSFNNDILIDGSMVFDANTINASDIVESLIYSDELLDIKNNPSLYLDFDKCSKISDNLYLVEASLKIRGKSKKLSFYLNIKNNTIDCEITVKCSDYDSSYTRKFKLIIISKY